MSILIKSDRPFRVAIVGSGPAGFYAAEALFRSGIDVSVSMFERLPTPYGLVRAGVAPDHLKIKSVTKVFDRIANHPNYSFWGNVTVGKDISVSMLKEFFDAIILAYGACSERRLSINGNELQGIFTATQFVGWYNAHPDYVSQHFDLSGESAVIIGQGNVALDICRMLAKPTEELMKTDIAGYAIETLRKSSIREIHVIGRRGPVQARFTPSELKELSALSDCRVVVSKDDLKLDRICETELELEHNTHARGNYELLRRACNNTGSNKGRITIYFHFFKRPTALLGKERLEKVKLERTRLEGAPGATQAVGTGIYEELNADILFYSIGYRGMPLEDIPFDEVAGVIPTQNHRVIKEGEIIPGLYACGWIKRGPTGVIGTNKSDAGEAVEALLTDFRHFHLCDKPSENELRHFLQSKGIRIVTFEDWKRLDSAEISRGKVVGKPREKFTTISEMLAYLDRG